MTVRGATLAIASLGVGWWLFADTYARHTGADRGDDTIRFAHFGTYQDYKLWRTVIAEFERDRPGIHVKQVYVVGLAGQYNTKMRQQILSNTLPDVALVQLGPFHELAEHFADLTELARSPSERSDSFAAVLDDTGLSAFTFEGRQHGLPVSGGNLLVYANPECFHRAAQFHGRPVSLPRDDWTMEDFRQTAELLTCDFDEDGHIDQFGFWLPRWIYFLPWIWSFGAELTDETVTRWTLVGPEAEQAFEFYRNLAVGDRVSPREEEVPQVFQDVGFLTGKVGMCVNGPWFNPFLAETGLADSYVVAPIPKGPAGRRTRITWDGVVMPKDLPPKRRAMAWQFIEYVLSEAVQDRIALSGRALPGRRTSSKAFVHPPDNPKRQPFVDALSYSRLQPRLPHFGRVDRAINRQLVRLLDPDRGMTAATMLEQLAHDPAIQTAFPAKESVKP